MTDNEIAALEQRLRREAKRQGLRVVKSRRRINRPYRLHHIALNRVVWVEHTASPGCWMSLAELAKYLWSMPNSTRIPAYPG